VTAAGLLGLAWAGAGPGHAVSLAEAKASDSIELLLALLLAATGLAIVARKIGIPYPILLVLGGLLIGFIPGLPSVQLAPDVVFLLFLPPILFAAGYFTSIRDLRKNLRAILLLAVGLVLFTTFLVGAVTKLLVPDMAWAVALTLGAIVSPPDAVAGRYASSGARNVITIEKTGSLTRRTAQVVASPNASPSAIPPTEAIRKVEPASTIENPPTVAATTANR